MWNKWSAMLNVLNVTLSITGSSIGRMCTCQRFENWCAKIFSLQLLTELELELIISCFMSIYVGTVRWSLLFLTSAVFWILTPNLYRARLRRVTAAPRFCSVIGATSIYTSSVSEAERLWSGAVVDLLTSSFWGISPWFMCFYHVQSCQLMHQDSWHDTVTPPLRFLTLECTSRTF